MHAPLILLAAFGLILSLAACGGSSDTSTRVAVCAKNYAPISAPDKGQLKNRFPLKRGEPITMPDGDYGYVSSDIFYHKVEEDVRIHISESQGRDGCFNPGLVCVSGKGITSEMADIAESVPLISDISHAVDGSTQMRKRTISFGLKHKERGVAPLIPPKVGDFDKAFSPGLPTELYGDYDTVDQSFNDFNLSPSSNVYQILTFLKKQVPIGKTDKMGTLELNIRETYRLMKPDEREEREKLLIKCAAKPPPN